MKVIPVRLFMCVATCALVGLLGCGDDDGSADTGAPDVGTDAQDAAADAVTDTATVDSGSADTGERRPPFVGPTGSTEGCGMSAETGLNGLLPIDVDGAERQYFQFIPESYDGETPLALVFAFHGLGDDAWNFQRAAQIEAATGDDAIVIYPRGLPASAGARGWLLNEDERDVAFVNALLDELTATLCIDRAKIFATGFSNGGFLANSLGCVRGDVFRAIAPLSGGIGTRVGCRGQVAVNLVHGTADALVPFAAGRGVYNYWRSTNQCGTEIEELDRAGCHARIGCDEGYPVVFCEHPGAHTVPLWARDQVWSFFQSL